MSKQSRAILIILLFAVLLLGILCSIFIRSRSKDNKAAAPEKAAEKGNMTAAIEGVAEMEKNIVSTSGAGKISIEPDIAYISLGVQTKNKESAQAAKENSALMNKILEAVKAEGIKDDELETSAYNIEPQYQYGDGKSTLDGYLVTNTIKITINDLSKVSTVLDLAVSAGANQVSNVVYAVKNQRQFYQQALEIAVKDARQKAEVMAKAADVKGELKPVKIIESYQGVSPIYREMADLKSYAAVDRGTEIMPGSLEITALVEVYFSWQ